LVAAWPTTIAALRRAQEDLAAETPPPWMPPRRGSLAIGGCAIRFERGISGAGHKGDPAWAAATVLRGSGVLAESTVAGEAGAPYEPGLLALREGPLLEAAVRALAAMPDVLLVDATGRDHPRRAGLALHLGAVLDVPTVGVTHRPLYADGEWPDEPPGSSSPLLLDGERVGAWLRTRWETRPVAVHAAWRTTPDVAVAVVRAAPGHRRTPEPLRHARHLARVARSGR
jgi:deoxyribonuclease V